VREIPQATGDFLYGIDGIPSGSAWTDVVLPDQVGKIPA